MKDTVQISIRQKKSIFLICNKAFFPGQVKIVRH